jgi:hypothetical protein
MIHAAGQEIWAMLQRTERSIRQNEHNSRKIPRERLEIRHWTHRLRARREGTRGRFVELP